MYTTIKLFLKLSGIKNQSKTLWTIFESIVYNRAIIDKRQAFLKVLVVHVIIIDQCNQIAH